MIRIITNITSLLLVLISMQIPALAQSLGSEKNATLSNSQTLVEKLLKTMNSGDYTHMKHFVQSHIAPSTLARISAHQYANYLAAESHFHGTLSFHSIEFIESSAQAVTTHTLVQSANTQLWYRMEMSVTQRKPFKMTRMRLRATQAPNAKTANATSEKDAVMQLSQYIDNLTNSETFSGAVLIAKGDNILMAKATGLASKRFNTANDLSTRFNLGSMNKMFTSIGILRLVAQNKLKLSDKVTTLLKITPEDSQLANIEIQHLLSHTSGIGGFNCDKGEVSIVQNKANCLLKLQSAQVNFTPGSRYRYSNDGMFVLGLVIEQISGQTYDDFIGQQVYQPAGMYETAQLDLQFPVENAAIGYSFYGAAQSWRNNLFIHDKKGGPAGGGYSTVSDLHRFALALTNNQLLSTQMTQRALTANTQFGANNYGYGFIIRNRNGKKVVGHNGAFPGVSAQLDIHLDSGMIVAVLSNHSFGADPIIEKINQLFGL